jgi:hypothetical protein
MRANESWSSFLFNSHVELTLLFGALVVGLAVGDYRNNMLFPESVTFAKKNYCNAKTVYGAGASRGAAGGRQY